MDMANAYYSWIWENFPQAHIVFDHIHVINLMNDKLDLVRRIIAAEMDDSQRKQLKGMRFVFLHNNIAFHRWCNLAEETGIPELKTKARTIRDKLDGIVTYWTFRHISNAKMERFNNKIWWLVKQAYGFRNREYFKLKIYQLPEISSEKSI